MVSNNTSKVLPVDTELDEEVGKTIEALNFPAENERVPLRAWTILFITCLGVLMASISTSALVIAFPTLLEELDMTINTVMLVLLVLLLVLAAAVTTAGKLGDIIGQATIFKIGYSCFTIGCLAAGFCDRKYRGYDLVGYRVIIGFGAALLFTNSAAIITTAFAPYNKVGLCQGVYQLSVALGGVLGPLIGGALATTNWRWIFWFNVPPSAICTLIAFYIIHDHHFTHSKNAANNIWEKLRTFDVIGAIFCSLSLIIIIIAMLQAVSPTGNLGTPIGIAALSIVGCICAIIFIMDQVYARDPLVPPIIFQNQVYSITLITSTFMCLVRNSIIYNMIFYLQGPFGVNPLQAGLYLVAYGLGNLVAGFVSGILADTVGIRNMILLGPLLCLVGMGCLSSLDERSSLAAVEGYLVIAGLGVGMFQAPNGAAAMLSVAAEYRGVAAAVIMLTNTFAMMAGMVITFSLVLHSISSTQLFTLFIYGLDGHDDIPVNNYVEALAIDYYILMGFALLTSIGACFLPYDLQRRIKYVQEEEEVKEGSQIQQIQFMNSEDAKPADTKIVTGQELGKCSNNPEVEMTDDIDMKYHRNEHNTNQANCDGIDIPLGSIPQFTE